MKRDRIDNNINNKEENNQKNKRRRIESSNKENDENVNVKKLLRERRELQIKQWDYYNKFREFQDKVVEMDKQILEVCKHKWVPDRSYCDHHTVFMCEICGLNR